ncbi:peptide ABC transporter ATP-binding protein [Pseudoroseomonas rhizosphaerae]|uniref:Peptide ABC transporter ATP-binding protein n=1 Tax=Teichococcus rhizosphaerae TaxID=1335062 RepID=A0A2C6Y132_9PROT|nr:ABC transporter ATP-binding protein [Pseudoroseomonas rhizosphaerae]PHK94502.1 peptide ABC transporter ATP-binding protein [Pseudoroseomonas rhizosphaerae]
MSNGNLVEIRDLRVDFPNPSGFTPAVRGVSFSLGREKLGIVGESGSGKSVTGRALMRLLPEAARVRAGALRFDGIDIQAASERQMRSLRGGRIGLIMQDPKYSLNPVMTVGAQIAEAWRAHNKGGKREARDAALALLEQVRIRDPARVLDSYPHEVSGGMGQRVMIAMMLAPNPDLLIADEPTSALDASVQAEILKLIEDLVSARGMGLMLISHDLPLVGRFCDRVVVMYAGQVMEELPARDLHRAQHAYTRGLLDCMPSLGQKRARLPTLSRDPAWLEPRA